MQKIATKTGLAHYASYCKPNGLALTICDKSFSDHKAAPTEREVDCSKCVKIFRMRFARKYFVVTINPRRLGRSWGSNQTSYGRNGKCTCGTTWYTNESGLGTRQLDKEAREWAHEHLLKHADELDAFQAEHEALPIACPDCPGHVMLADDSDVLSCPRTFCGTELRLGHGDITLLDLETTRAWHNRA